ncbi:MAG: hypothetical protein IID32_08665 [Planctomycetes bacterium]|nr:hypothetical protein [Planctomycetota bacterium]
MSQPDLIPEEFRFDQQRKRRLRLWIILSAVTLCLNGTWVGHKGYLYRQADRDQNRDTRQLEDIRKNIQSLIQAKSEMDHWQDRIAVLDRMGRYPDYIWVLEFLARQSPKFLVLSKMSLGRLEQAGPKGSSALPKGAEMFELAGGASEIVPNTIVPDEQLIVMTLNGHCLDYQVVAEYIKVLRTSERFVRTQLIRSWRQPNSKVKGVEFEIACILHPIHKQTGVEYADQQQSEPL